MLELRLHRDGHIDVPATEPYFPIIAAALSRTTGGAAPWDLLGSAAYAPRRQRPRGTGAGGLRVEVVMRLLFALSLTVLLAAAACKNTNDNKPSYDLVPLQAAEASV